MGAISIGLTCKPKGKVCVYSWDENNEAQRYVAVSIDKSTLYTIEEFCNDYTDKDYAQKELENYRKANIQYILYSRSFAFGRTASDARSYEVEG